MSDELLTTEEAAEWLKVHPDTVYRWIAEGTLPALKIGGTYRIFKAAVLAMKATGGGGDQDGDERP